MEESAEIEKRMEGMETKLAYQELTIAELSALVFEQSRALERLEAALRKTASRVKELSEGKQPGLPENERPPHY
jgi:SlyX protein